jgi:hypothetical protein
METTVKQRITSFIKFKGISVREFERLCGLSNGYVNSITQTVMPNKLKSISLQYPDLNLGWITTGEGTMLKETSNYTQHEPVESKIPSPESEYSSKEDRLLKIIESQQKTIEKLTELMAQKKQDVYMAAKVAGAG